MVISQSVASFLISHLNRPMKSRERLDKWVVGLPPAQEIIMREVIQKIDDYFEGRESGDSEIHYVLDKRVAEPWNLIFDAQYQHNKNWQIRSEIGTFGKRTSFCSTLTTVSLGSVDDKYEND